MTLLTTTEPNMPLLSDTNYASNNQSNITTPNNNNVYGNENINTFENNINGDNNIDATTVSRLQATVKRTVVGDLASKLYPHVRLPECNVYRVLVVGPSNAGKSSLIVSFATAYEGSDTVQWLRAPVSASRDMKRAEAKTPRPRGYYFSLGINRKEEECILEVVDTRGAGADDDYLELAQLGRGDLSMRGKYTRTGEKTHVDKFTNYVGLENKLSYFHAALVVIPADFSIDLAPIKKLLATLEDNFITTKLVITGTDTKRDFSHILNSLNVNINQVFPFVPYNSSNQKVNDYTNYKVLSLFHETMISIEGSLNVHRRSELAIIKDTVKYAVADTVLGARNVAAKTTQGVSVGSVFLAAALILFLALLYRMVMIVITVQ